ncbi:MAG: KEOPS complex kinase/ATPase Bud32 [Candidatus Micrarchaeota archaeon]
MAWKGAEATVTKEGATVRKKRLKKKYRDAQLDALLRSRRTRREARILRKAKAAGAPVPELLKEDERKCELQLSLVKGTLMARLVEEDARELQALSAASGTALAKLHAAGIVHGDYSTSNIIASRTPAVTVIDFGLSEFSDSLEERAEDVLLYRKSLREKQALFKPFCKAYERQFPVGTSVVRRAEEILKRARYAER